MKEISIEKIIRELSTSNFVLGCCMPLGYTPGFPILQVKNERLCIMFPYLKYKITGKVDKTLVFPIRYIVTVELPQITPVLFKDLSLEPSFRKVDFAKPVGYFRHDSIKKYNKEAYQTLRNELLMLYDKVVAFLLYNAEYTKSDEIRMRELLHLLPEPSLKPIYKALDDDFYRKYME